MCGAQGTTALAEFAGRLTQSQLRAVRSFRSPRTGRLVAPSKTCLHRIVSELDPEELDKAVRCWVVACRGSEGTLAVDGKVRPLSRPGGSDTSRMMVAAMEHGSGVIHGQTASDSAGGGILGVRRLLGE